MNHSNTPDRRTFLKTTAASAVAAPLAIHAAGSDLIKVGLIGCGGRGTGAASQALLADSNIRLTAMGDLFEDRLNKSHDSLQAIPALKGKIDVPVERRFTGWNAFREVIESGVDSVLLTTPPHFRPRHQGVGRGQTAGRGICNQYMYK